MGTIRAAGIRGFSDVVRRAGGDPVDLVRRVGLDPAALAQDELPIADHRLAALLDLAAAELDLPDIGLRMAATHDLDMLGPLAVVLENSRTGDEALTAAMRYLSSHSDAMAIHRDPDPLGEAGVVAIRYRAHDVEPAPIHAIDAGIGYLHRVIGMLVGAPYGLLEVRLRGTPVAPLSAYRAFFGAPVSFGAPAAILRMPAAVFDRPIAGGQEALRAQAEAYLRALVPDDLDLIARVRGVIQATLLELGVASIETTARAMATHPRTLQRRIAEHATTFARVLDDVRRDEARHLLVDDGIPCQDISVRLGFAEQASLSRACRRWWGVPPTAVRARTVA